MYHLLMIVGNALQCGAERFKGELLSKNRPRYFRVSSSAGLGGYGA
jgi:hypothetical protein